MAAAAATAHVQAGRLRALGAAGLRRITALPDLPTISELGYTGFDWDEWNGLWTVAGTPASSVAKLHAATVFALNQPDVQARMNQIGIVPLALTLSSLGPLLLNNANARPALSVKPISPWGEIYTLHRLPLPQKFLPKCQKASGFKGAAVNGYTVVAAPHHIPFWKALLSIAVEIFGSPILSLGVFSVSRRLVNGQ
jgi:hypothetical protein